LTVVYYHAKIVVDEKGDFMKTFREAGLSPGRTLLLSAAGINYTVLEVVDEVMVVVTRNLVLKSLEDWYQRGVGEHLVPALFVGLAPATEIKKGGNVVSPSEKGIWIVTAVDAQHQIAVLTETRVITDPRQWSLLKKPK